VIIASVAWSNLESTMVLHMKSIPIECDMKLALKVLVIVVTVCTALVGMA